MVRVGLKPNAGSPVPVERVHQGAFSFIQKLFLVFLVDVGLVVVKPHFGFMGHLGDERFEVIENVGAKLLAIGRVSQRSAVV